MVEDVVEAVVEDVVEVVQDVGEVPKGRLEVLEERVGRLEKEAEVRNAH